jgi:hypothetical protein
MLGEEYWMLGRRWQNALCLEKVDNFANAAVLHLPPNTYEGEFGFLEEESILWEIAAKKREPGEAGVRRGGEMSYCWSKEIGEE